MTYVLIAKWTAKEGEEAEPGCLMWQLHRDPENSRVFVVYEQYVDTAALEAHGASEHFRRYALEDAIPRLESRERAFYETIDV
jgi:quinol monooxygenase YgiN